MSNTRTILIWNQLDPHRMPSPITVNSCSGLSRPQVDNAGPPGEWCQSSSNNSPPPARHAPALYASGHFSRPHFLPSLLQCLQYRTQLKMNVGNTTRINRRDQYQLSATAVNGALLEALRGKSSPEFAALTSNSLSEADCSHALPRTDCLAGSPAEFHTKTQPDGELNFCCSVRSTNIT